MSDLISRQAAIAIADELKSDLPDDERIADMVMAHNEGVLEYQTALSLLLSAQPDRKTGKWENNHTTCSECGWQMIDDVVQSPNMVFFNFCPNCGAEMRGEQDG